jgi:hypothetical protein
VKTLPNAEGEAMPRREEPDLHPLVLQDENGYENQDDDQNHDQGDDRDEKYDFLTFIKAAGFEVDELLLVTDELDAYKSIPGTTLRRYVNRVQSSVEVDCRLAFLKGVIVGTAIHESLENPDLEKQINAEVNRRLREILDELDPA